MTAIRWITILVSLFGLFSVVCFAPHTFFWGAMFGVLITIALDDITDAMKGKQ